MKTESQTALDVPKSRNVIWNSPIEDGVVLHAGQGFGTRSERYMRRKYLVERLIAYALLLPALLVVALLCIAVRLHSAGPGLYRQVRVGLRGRRYEIIKIRTMWIDAEADGKPRWCTKGDSRITPIGRIIRKLHLDELPQLLNIVRGEMTLVGPRPERPELVEELKQQIPGYESRLSVMPGITGLAQINLPPDETIDDVRRKQYLDLLYIEEANFWLDARMLLATSVRLVGLPGTSVIRAFGLSRVSELPREKSSEEFVPEKDESDSYADLSLV